MREIDFMDYFIQPLTIHTSFMQTKTSTESHQEESSTRLKAIK